MPNPFFLKGNQKKQFYIRKKLIIIIEFINLVYVAIQ